MSSFCTQCGAALSEGQVFCTCGAQRAAAPEASSAGAPKSAGVLRKLLIGTLLICFLVAVSIVGVVYVVHRARQKVAELEARHRIESKQADLKNPAAAGAAIDARLPATTANAAGSAAAGATPAGVEPAPGPAAPIVPVAASGDQAHDWALEYERTVGGPEADLVVRTGDINNLGFGWKYYDWDTKQTKFLDPFSGQSTQPHPWPDIHRIPPDAPPGTDRIMLGSAVIAGLGDGYSGAIADCMADQALAKSATSPLQLSERCKQERALTAATPIVLPVGALPAKINAVLFQIFVDDFQPGPLRSHFQVSLNGTRIPNFEYAINALDQSGPIGKLLTLKLLPEYWPLLNSGTVSLLIDDPTTHVPDGYAVDFVRILVNPHGFKYQVSLTAKVTDADKHSDSRRDRNSSPRFKNHRCFGKMPVHRGARRPGDRNRQCSRL